MPKPTQKVHDRLSQDLPIGAKVAIAIVPDPYSHIGEKIKVLRSTRDDPLAGMLSRAQIDEAQYVAGRKWQAHYEGAEVGSIRAIDPAKEYVDGGSFPEPLTDRKIESMKALRDADACLGDYASKLVRDILGNRIPIGIAAVNRGLFSARQINNTGREFRNGLEKLAILWGFASKPVD